MLAEITVGMDTEACLVRKNGEAIDAENYLKEDGSFGCDGRHDTAEIRPRQAISLIELTSNVRENILTFDKMFNGEYGILVGHYKHTRPLGGHIHFGFKPGTPQQREILTKMLNSRFKILRDLFEPEEEIEKRVRTGYGLFKRNSYREQAWGIEYRPPCSFILTPETTLLYLAVAKTVLTMFIDSKIKNIRSINTLIKELQAYADNESKLAIDYLKKLLEKPSKLNWNENIIPAWK